MDVGRRGDVVAVRLGADDAFVLRMLASAVRRLLLGDDEAGPGPADVDPLEALVGMDGEPVAVPEDPALRRLLPDAYADDPDAAAEYRRLMDADLRRGKVTALDQLLAGTESGGAATPVEVELGPGEVEVWLQALNDVRLVLGVRLDIDDDFHAKVADMELHDPRLPLVNAYDRLSTLQDRLVDTLVD